MKKKAVAHNTEVVNLPITLNFPSVIPDDLKGSARNLRLLGVWCPASGSIVFSSTKKSDCEKFIKAASYAHFYIVRFDAVV